MFKYFFLIAIIFSSASFAQVKKKALDGSEIQKDNLYPRVRLVTSKGDVTVELDRAKAPIAVNNFLRYAKMRSFEDTVFHRIIEEFVVQGGGFDAEFKEKPEFKPIFNESGNGLKNDMYTISMARAKPHGATRQFFFNMQDNDSLNPGKNWGYTVFGYAVEGTDVLDAMAAVETGFNETLGWDDVPVEPILLKKVDILPEVKY